MKAVVADPRYRVICLRIVPKTGSPIYLTHYPRDLVIGGHTYLTSAGYEFSGYSAAANLSPPVVDLEGIAGMAGLGADAIQSGLFDGARCYLFATSWAAPVEDQEPLTASILGKTVMMDTHYKIEEMGLVDALAQSIGKTYTAQCPKTFGGQEYAGCKMALAGLTVTGTLTAVADASHFTDSVRGEAADYFGAGTIQFTTGANAGLKPLEVKVFSVGGVIEVFEPFYYLPTVGDAYTMIPGCRKRRAEDCYTKWNNVVNFGGFEHIPLGSAYAQVGKLMNPDDIIAPLAR
jgi:uncharacterized phage protein (TIGR02218 family)